MVDLQKLMDCMIAQDYSETIFKAYPKEINNISDRCRELTQRDYKIQVLQNSVEVLCAHYPPTIFIPTIDTDIVPDLSSLVSQAKFARSRTRFVAPAFSYQDKVICRSSTLSGSLELYGRQVANVAGFNFDTSSAPSNSDSCGRSEQKKLEDDRSIMKRVRDDDCELMKRFGVRYICDFMLEYRKVKYWVPVTSSEKADQDSRYHDFVILPMPYPGSEFFRLWRDSGYAMQNLLFDWTQPEIEVILDPSAIPKTLLSCNIDWINYKSWDLTTLTTNYLKLLLGLLFEGAGGLLLHCISGWDRTPLFVSLMRCLLWADFLVHSSLNAEELLYYTLAYDWYLFGHKLRTRFEIGEEILRFAFAYLGEIAVVSDLSIRAVYDMVIPPEEPTRASDSKEEFVEVKWSPSLLQARRTRLKELSELFLRTWDASVKSRSDFPRAYVPSDVVQPDSAKASQEEMTDGDKQSCLTNDDQTPEPIVSQQLKDSNISHPTDDTPSTGIEQSPV